MAYLSWGNNAEGVGYTPEFFRWHSKWLPKAGNIFFSYKQVATGHCVFPVLISGHSAVGYLQRQDKGAKELWAWIQGSNPCTPVSCCVRKHVRNDNSLWKCDPDCGRHLLSWFLHRLHLSCSHTETPASRFIILTESLSSAILLEVSTKETEK